MSTTPASQHKVAHHSFTTDTLEITLDNGTDFSVEVPFPPTAPGDVIVEQSPDGEKLLVGYITDDYNGHDLADMYDLRRDDSEDGRLYEVGDRRSPDSKNIHRVTRDIFDEASMFMGEKVKTAWDAIFDHCADGDELKTLIEVLTGREGDSALQAIYQRNPEDIIDIEINHGETTYVTPEVAYRLMTEGYNEGTDEDEVIEAVQDCGYEAGQPVATDVFEMARHDIEEDDPDLLIALVQELRALGAPVFPVECYEHGLSHYSIAGTMHYPDRQWDVGLSGFYIAPKDIIQEIFKGNRTPEDGQKYAQNVLQTFTDWGNGAVYGQVVLTCKIDVESETIDIVDEDTCFGMVGRDFAEDEMAGVLLLALTPNTSGEAHAAALGDLIDDRIRDDRVRQVAVEGILNQGVLKNRGDGEHVICGSAVGAARADFSSRNLAGLKFQDRNGEWAINDATFEDASLRATRWRNVTVQDSSFKGADLSYVDLRNVNFQGHNDFSDAILTGANLPENFLDRVSAEGAQVAGARVGRDQILEEMLGAPLTP